MSLLRELQRRNVGRVATAYIVASWLIVQVADTVLLNFNVPERVFQIVVIVLAIGFVPTVIVAWLFEWTPEGLRRDADVELSADAKLSRARHFDRGIIVVLLVAVSYFAIDKFVLTEPAVDEGFYGTRSIAVMPFEVNSSDPEQQFFANGVTDEIHYLLDSIRDLRVIAERSSTKFHDDQVGIAEIRDVYKVGHLLEGSVRMAGSKVRVTARLIETSTETQLWTDIYERELDDVFEIQNDIAANVVHSLKIEIAEGLDRARQTDPEVVALVQQAKMVFQVRDGEVGLRMQALLKRALELDPDYVPAIEWLVNAEWMRAYEGTLPREEQRRREMAARERLVELEPQSPYVAFSEAFDLWQDGEWERAADAHLGALALDLTDSSQVRLSAMFARDIGKLDVAQGLAEHAVAVDPYCYECIRVLSQILMYRGDVERAIRERERFLALSLGGGRPDYSIMLMLAGRPEEVAAVWASVPDERFDKPAYLAMAAHSAGDDDSASRLLRLLEERVTADEADSRARFPLAIVHAWMGNTDEAFGILIPLVKQEGSDNIRVFSPEWREIRDDPRWQELRAAIGMSAERLDAIEFDPWLPE